MPRVRPGSRRLGRSEGLGVRDGLHATEPAGACRALPGSRAQPVQRRKGLGSLAEATEHDPERRAADCSLVPISSVVGMRLMPDLREACQSAGRSPENCAAGERCQSVRRWRRGRERRLGIGKPTAIQATKPAAANAIMPLPKSARTSREIPLTRSTATATTGIGLPTTSKNPRLERQALFSSREIPISPS